MIRNPKYLYGPRDIEVPGHLHLGEFILKKLWNSRHKDALINGVTDERLTYANILQYSMNLAISLTRLGAKKGDVIGIFSENRDEFWPAIFGSICAGAVVTTISTGYVEQELKHVMSISKPKYLICSPAMYKNNEKSIKSLKHVSKVIVFGNDIPKNALSFQDLAVNVNNVSFEEFQCVEVCGQNDPVFIVYSSGTTGLPKGVLLTHLNVIVCCNMPVSADPSRLGILITPWYHVMGLVGTLTSFAYGRTSVYLFKFDIDAYLGAIQKYKVSYLSVVPPLLVAISKTQKQYDLSSVEVIMSGAAPLQKETIPLICAKFPQVSTVHQGYGLSETTLAVTRYSEENMARGVEKIGSVGPITAGFIMKFIDTETKEVLGANKPGEICVKGLSLMKGYIGIDTKDHIDEEGFYHTGDVGYYDDEGFIFIVDRVKELIKYKGFQVPPAELESLILSHPAVQDVGVVGVAHGAAGEVPLAFVVKQPGKELTEEDIQQLVRDKLSNPKHLRGGVRFVNQIPKSASGKILRKELKKMVGAKSKL